MIGCGFAITNLVPRISDPRPVRLTNPGVPDIIHRTYFSMSGVQVLPDLRAIIARLSLKRSIKNCRCAKLEARPLLSLWQRYTPPGGRAPYTKSYLGISGTR